MSISLDGFRRSARSLRQQPVFTTVVVLSLALAIALNTTMYSVLDAIAHPRLDMRDPGALYWIRFYGDYKGMVAFSARDSALASGMQSYESVTRSEGPGASVLLEHGQNFYEGKLAAVGENFFDVVGPRVLAGRTFLPSDANDGDAAVVLDETAAHALFPNGQSPVGQRVDFNSRPRVVIGVISRASDFPNEHTAAWAIAPPVARGMYSRLVRLRPGVSPLVADRELSVVGARIAIAAGEAPRDVAFRFHQAADPDFQVRGFDYALIFAVAAVLLVACANLANLQLARGLTRRRDLALRAALGATRRRLVAHLLTESTLLAAAGLLTGLLLTFLGGKLLRASIPPSVGRYVVTPHMSWRVLAFALVAAIACLLMTGLLPSIFVSRANPNELLKSAAGTGATRRNRNRYGLLVSVEIALSLALMSGAAVMVRAALRVRELGYGFDPRPLATGYAFPYRKDKTTEPYSETLQYIAARIGSIGGVTAAAATVQIGVQENAVTVDDAGGPREFPAAGYAALAVSPNYLRTVHMPIVAGRDFFDGERDAAAVIVDEHTARVLWPNANPIGGQIKLGDLKSNLPYVRVVGVVAEQPGFTRDVLYNAAPGSSTPSLGRIFYLPGPSDRRELAGTFPFSFVARTAGSPAQLAIAIRRDLFRSSDLFGSRIMSMDEFLGLTAARDSARFTASLFSLFAALGVGLAAFGVYGVVAHSVTERRRELGVRIALGATAGNILHAVLRESVVVALAGVAIGLLCTKYAEPLLLTFTTGGDLYDVLIFAGASAVLVTTAFVAAMIPAIRATRVDPTESLRND